MQDLIDRRKHNRFKVKENAFAVITSAPADLGRIEDMSMGEIALSVLKTKPVKMGQIVNISKGGLAFRHIDSGLEAGKSLKLDILFAQDAFYLKSVAFKTVSEFDAVSEFPFSSIIMKQQGVQFGDMDSDQIAQLDYFIKNHTKGEVRSELKPAPVRLGNFQR